MSELLDGYVGGTLVIRDGRVVYASAGAAALLGRGVDEVVGSDVAGLLAPGERERVLERYRRRLRGEPVPDEYETAILRGDGTQRPIELRVAVDGTDMVVRVRDVSVVVARRARLAALAQLGVDLLRERDEEAVFARLRSGLWAAGLASFLMHPETDGVRVSWACLPRSLEARFEAEVAEPLVGFVAPWTPFTRTAWEEGGAYADDFAHQAAALVPAALADAAREIVAAERLTRAVAVRIDERAAPRFYLVAVGDWLRIEDLPALRLLGAQVGAALDAARTIAGLARHNADLAALNRIGELAGESSDLDGFLAGAAGVVRQASGCDGVAYFTAADGGRELVLRLQDGATPEASVPFGRIAVEGEVARIVGGRAPFVARLSALPPDRQERLRLLGFGTFAWVPLVARSSVPGLMTVAWRAEMPAQSVRLGFLQAAGAHVAAAIESFGLLASLRGRVGELTLLNDLAMATAALDPVLLLESAVGSVSETVGADAAIAYVLEEDGLASAASLGLPGWALERVGRLPAGEGMPGQAVARLAPVVSSDPGELGAAWAEIQAREGFGRLAAVPLLSKSRALGALVVGRRAARDFTPDEVALLSAIGAQLGVAVDNARLYTEARRRAEELGLVHEMGRSLVSTLRLDEVLDDGTRNLARIVDAPQAYLLLADREARHLEIRSATGPGAAPLVGERIPLGDPDGFIGAHVFHNRRPLIVEDSLQDSRVSPALRARVKGISYLALPLVVRDRAIGAAIVVETRTRRRFTPAEVERAAAIANQIAIAVENARLYDDLSRSYAELARAQRQLVHRERLAALGELAAVVAHEVRNPLGVIFNSLGSLRRLLRPTGDARMLLDIVGEEADRLNRIVGDLLDFARPSTPVLAPASLEQVVEEAVASALAEHPAGIEVAREIEEGLPPVPMDARLVRQAAVNLVANAVQAMPRGGRVTVRLARAQDAVVLEVRDEGPGVPAEVLARIFEPFFTTKASGTGLGLAVVKRIAEGHGGDVTVVSRPGSGASFSIRFPLAPPAGSGSPDRTIASGSTIG